MTDREPPVPDHDPDPATAAPGSSAAAEAERVRRLLAAARHTDPLPIDVRDRLDATLAGLVAERRTGASGGAIARPGPVAYDATDEVGSRRRRRRAGRLLLAAAAVVLVGYGVGSVADGVDLAPSGSGESASDGGFASEREDADGAASGLDESYGAPESAPSPSFDAADGDLNRLPRVDAGSLRQDAETLSFAAITDSGEDRAARRADAACRAAAGDAPAVGVEYRGRLATLVYSEARGGERLVRLYRCRPPELLRRVVIPAAPGG